MKLSFRAKARLFAVSLLAWCAPALVAAQTLPAEPIVFADGRVTLGGNVSATIGPHDPGFFNFSDYENSALRLLQVDLTASVRLNDHLTALTDIRAMNKETPQPYGLYLRIRPWTSHNFDIQAGLIPPTFGAFARRTYASDNLLISYPLAYQYLTSLRHDAVPATTDELARMRGRGWLSFYSVGDQAGDVGLSIASAYRWDVGVQAHGGNNFVEVTGAVTNGALSYPRIKDDNADKNVAGRVAIRPFTGLVLGGSLSRGAYLSDALATALPGTDLNALKQTAVGGDIEYSRGYYLVRAESILSDWTIPSLPTLNINAPLRAVATYVEGRYKLRPGLYVAGRYDYLTFSDITTSTGARMGWDAPVTRVEIGGGYSIQRNLIAKLSVQHDRRSAGRIHTATLGAAQLLFWF